MDHHHHFHQDTRAPRGPILLLAALSLAAAQVVVCEPLKPLDLISSGQLHQVLNDKHSHYQSDLEAAASDFQQQQPSSATSHEILAAGWPATSPMWPTIQSGDHATPSTSPFSSLMFEPFIYADKPSELDYSLLLSLNKTFINETLKMRFKMPLFVQLSFEYYFNQGERVTSAPNIKIEIDRKETKYVSATASTSRLWLAHSENLQLAEPSKLDKPDWLKLSLINREAPSLVAIRRLKVSFSSSEFADLVATTQSPAVEAPTSSSGSPQPPPSPPPQAPANPLQEAPLAPPPSPPTQEGPGEPNEQPAPEDANAYQPPSSGGSPGPEDNEAQASNAVSSTLKPVAPKRKSWTSILGRRRRKKRQVSANNEVGQLVQASNSNSTSAGSNEPPLLLTCFTSHSCEHWKADSSNGLIQWSLARMPPATSNAHSGYFYASNRLNYGNSSRLLRLSLNQTESATIADQNADHCLELAIYVTEGARLKLFKLSAVAASGGGQANGRLPSLDEDESRWTRGSLLMSWAPTLSLQRQSLQASLRLSANASSYLDGMQLSERAHLSGAQLAAASHGQSGWTLETLCFGDFFHNVRDCGQNQCALGFQMDLLESKNNALEENSIDATNQQVGDEQQPQEPFSGGQLLGEEQVVGVALLRQHALNIPNTKQLKPARWLETWQRAELRPDDNWRFYPKLDYAFQADNVSLVNLYDGATYSIQSDWLLVGESLNFEASFLIEVLETASSIENQAALNTTSNTNATATLQSSSEIQLALIRETPPLEGETPTGRSLFKVHAQRRLVDANFEPLASLNSTIDWLEHYNNSTRLALFNMSLPDVSAMIREARHDQLLAAPTEDSLASQLFKIIIDLSLELGGGGAENTQQSKQTRGPMFKLTLANVSLADRCHPSPCQFGACLQNGTQLNDWQCQCDSSHRGRRCEFGRWCSLAHVAPPPASSGAGAAVQLAPPPPAQLAQTGSGPAGSQLVILKQQEAKPAAGTNGLNQQQQQTNMKGRSSSQLQLIDLSARLTGREFCQRKLGAGSKCVELDVALNDQLYLDEEQTFSCACQDDFYLSDESKCKQAHQCHSIVCPSIGQICDESRPFNRTQPCQCNEKLDWHQDAREPSKCSRRQCHDKKRDCGFEAHICLPTLPGERPICKCGPKFALATRPSSDKKAAVVQEIKYCQSTACVLPTLNDCQQICLPDDTNLERPYTCACHEGYTLDKADQRTCRPNKQARPVCKPACDARTQICTEFGCRCKQGFVPDGETIVQQQSSGHSSALNSTTTIDYVKSVRCLNVCSLSYAENKAQFERIEMVCPLGLCNPSDFNCRCSDPASSALVQTKYEPIYANDTLQEAELPAGETSIQLNEDDKTNRQDDEQFDDGRKRISPLCHLKRVCKPQSTGFQLCKARGAICVPDYTRPTMFDCVCPPGTEKRLKGTAGDFQCEPRCASIKLECLKKQAICRPIGSDQVRCDCLPGMQLDAHEQRCYLARYTYALNLILVNKYYEPEALFHRHSSGGRVENSTSNTHNNGPPNIGPVLHEIMPQFQHAPVSDRAGRALRTSSQPSSSSFIAELNQCNISQLIPSSILNDPYEHEPTIFLQYIDQCNQQLHKSSRTSQLNSRLAEDLRQALGQHLRDFTVTTNNTLCQELALAGPDGATLISLQEAAEASGQINSDEHKSKLDATYLNCTVFLQSREPIEPSTIKRVLSSCDKNGQDERFCWIKPRLLLLKRPESHQDLVIPCEMAGFCGEDATSVRLDDKTSLCSCKCPADVEMIDLKELEARAPISLKGQPTGSSQQMAIKEICAPRNHCGANSTYCQFKIGSVCQYDVRTGARCNCVYPAYEDSTGRCVEVTFSQLDNTLIVFLIMVGTCLLVSLAINLYALARSRRNGLFGRSKQYPMSEFTSSTHRQPSSGERISTGEPVDSQRQQAAGRPSARPLNRSTGMPNLAFDPDD